MDESDALLRLVVYGGFAVGGLALAWWARVRRERREERERELFRPPARAPVERPTSQRVPRGEVVLDGSRVVAPPPPVVVVPPQAPAPRQRPKPRPKSLNLDAGQFAPMSHDEVKRQAGGIGRWSPLFGRRDLIPPADDPRTALIDRAMVGQGLITSEQLAEIHEIGRQMEEVRPQLANAMHEAERALARSVEEKKALKERKKAEAAERKRQHDEAVAQRRATDIIFLGRGVSAGLADRRANVEKLTTAGLPLLATPADVAAAMGLTLPQLRWLAFHAEASAVSHYVRFDVPKRSGGKRALFAPHKKMAAAQEWVLRNILEKVPVHPAAQGFVKGRSTVTNSAPHVGRAVVVNADLRDFFPTVTFPRVRGIFREMGYSPAAATIFALLCTESPRRLVTYAGKRLHVATGPRGLPQGACTSPALSNLACRRMDSRLNGIAGKLGWAYSRYADDLTFSGDGEAMRMVGYVLARVRHICEDEGFVVNEKKTRVLRQAARQEVTGVVVNRKPNVPRALRRRMRAILHRAKFEGLERQNRQNHPHFEGYVRGMIAYVGMVNPESAKPLREAFESLS